MIPLLICRFDETLNMDVNLMVVEEFSIVGRCPVSLWRLVCLLCPLTCLYYISLPHRVIACI